jgi:hypothetical protein
MVRTHKLESDAETLQQLVVDIWNVAQNCDGSRADQQQALDNIQQFIEVEVPDVEDYETSDRLEHDQDEASEDDSNE